ncbi:MAG TPA: peptide ABC transporter substrate-binding protein [Phycisphaerae bacterium]|nr:peptide ABC transporter substrate-binding protein [Phycisphaerae bacterium]
MWKSSWRGAAALLILGLIPASLVVVTLDFGHRKAALRFSQGPEVPTLDPQKMQDVSGGRIAGALFEGLAVFDPVTASPKPGVAHRWDISDDGLVYTFHLRDDARWSDGSQLTAEDFRYSWRRALDARTGSPYNYLLFAIKGSREYVEATTGLAEMSPEQADAVVEAAAARLGIEAVSPTVLRVTLERPTRAFIDLVAFHTLLPVKQSSVETSRRVRAGDDPTDPAWTHPGRIVSNGPYVLDEWKLKYRMRLVRNEHYWNRKHVRVPTIDVYPAESPETVYLQYELGQLDLITDVPNLAAEQLLKERRAGRRLDFHGFPYCGTYFLRFNCTKPPLDDRRVRLALSLALDKQEIVDRAGRLGQPVARTFVPEGQIPWYKGPEGHGRDVERARRLLAEAGYPGGKGFPTLRYLYNTSEAHKRIAELVAEQWRRELGIVLTLQNIEWKVFLEKVGTLDYDIARAAWIADYLDPMTFLDMFVTGGGNNDTGWSNPEYDRLIGEAGDTVDMERQADIFRRAEAILIEEEMPVAPVYYYVSASLVRDRVKGYVPNPLNRIAFEDLWIDAAEGGP